MAWGWVNFQQISIFVYSFKTQYARVSRLISPTQLPIGNALFTLTAADTGFDQKHEHSTCVNTEIWILKKYKSQNRIFFLVTVFTEKISVLLCHSRNNPHAQCTPQTDIKAFNAGGEIFGELNHLVSCPTQENTSQFTFHGWAI